MTDSNYWLPSYLATMVRMFCTHENFRTILREAFEGEETAEGLLRSLQYLSEHGYPNTDHDNVVNIVGLMMQAAIARQIVINTEELLSKLQDEYQDPFIDARLAKV